MTRRILIVDDDEATLSLVKSLLDGAGYTIIKCASAEAAITELNNGNNVDVVFTDVYLGEGENGYQLAQSVKILWPDTKVLVTSGFTELALSARGMPATDFPFLQKPYKRASLLTFIEKNLNGSKPT